ncbi:MAG: hypothetical protein EPN34_05250 [Burkholderiaceae bacterium]|jgi:hypothetical protein|nr:MAG: hypothetical protein EPN34_05250 [Burkholderiaceae bacterium]
MKSKLSIVAIALLLAACATPPQSQWEKDGATSYDRTSAQSECEYQIEMNKTPTAKQAGLMNLCMQGKGFRLKPAK